MGLLNALYTLFTDPGKAVSDVAAIPLDYACQSRVDEATRKTKWWADNGIWIGAGAVLAVVVLRDITKKK